MNLGELSGACLMDPETCTNGATLMAWIKINSCAAGPGVSRDGGIIGALQNSGHVGFEIRCAFYLWYNGGHRLHLG